MSTLTDDDLRSLLDEVASSYPIPVHAPDEILAAVAEEPAAVPLVRRRWVQLSAAAVVVAAGAVYGLSQYGGDSAPSNKLTAAGVERRVDSYGKFAPGAAVPAPPIYTSMQGAPESLQRTGATAGTTKALSGMTLDDNLRAPVPAALNPVAGTAQHSFAGSAGSAQGAVAPPVSAPATDEGDSRVVKSGTIALVVKDKRVSPTLSAVQQAAKAEGGYIASSSSDEYGDTPSGEVTIRVPVDRFEDLVAKVRGLDAKVRTASTSGKDVTAQYSDLESQLRTLKATRERFLVILSQTKTIGEILTVQQRVDNVSGQIDRIEGQRKLLASQSDLSTLTVSVSEAGDPVVKATSKPRSGLSQAFVDAKNGFVNGVESIVRHSGGFLLFLICLAVVLVVGRLSWRVARRRLV